MMTIALTSPAAAPFPNWAPRRNSSDQAGKSRAGTGLAGWCRRRADRRRERRELESLLDASDHILRDIGVTRYDLKRALLGL